MVTAPDLEGLARTPQAEKRESANSFGTSRPSRVSTAAALENRPGTCRGMSLWTRVKTHKLEMSLWFAAFRILLPDALTQNLRVASDTYTFMSLDPSSPQSMPWPTVLTVVWVGFVRDALSLMIRDPARPSRPKLISIPSAQRGVCARRSRPAKLGEILAILHPSETRHPLKARQRRYLTSPSLQGNRCITHPPPATRCLPALVSSRGTSRPRRASLVACSRHRPNRDPQAVEGDAHR